MTYERTVDQLGFWPRQISIEISILILLPGTDRSGYFSG